MSKTVVIPCAGLGSRLGDFTANYNKAMCTLGPKPVISYIIEKFSDEDEIIILLGYKGDYLRQVIEACYPEKNITFVDVDIYEGEGSGLGYSLSRAIDLLQKPFIFWSNDTIIDIDLNSVDYDYNWLVTSKCDESRVNDYRHAVVVDGMAVNILSKQPVVPENAYPYVGVSFIKNYEKFWTAWFDNQDMFIKSGETAGLNKLEKIKNYTVDKWIDTGNRHIFELAKKEYNNKMDEIVLEKPDESIWFINDKVIKFHVNEKFISDRVKRFDNFLCDKQIKNKIRIPKLLSYSKNVYAYKRVDGVILSKILTKNLFYTLLYNFFDCDKVDMLDEQKIEIYNDFYKNKTLSRIDKYCLEMGEYDKDCYINDCYCYSAKSLVKNLDWKQMALKGVFTYNYHGDFHPDNILYDKSKDQFIMLDWRQNFGKSDIGDLYYDLAKMLHCFIVDHSMVKAELFKVEDISDNKVNVDIHRTFILTELEEALIKYCEKSDIFDVVQVKVLTAIVFLNIAACHTYPYNRFLFYIGKYLLNKYVQEYGL